MGNQVLNVASTGSRNIQLCPVMWVNSLVLLVVQVQKYIVPDDRDRCNGVQSMLKFIELVQLPFLNPESAPLQVIVTGRSS